VPAPIIADVLTNAARRSLADPTSSPRVGSLNDILNAGRTYDEARAHIRANRWQQIGRAVVRHNGEPTVDDLRQAALVVLGPRAALTSFTALSEWGLDGWEREPVHVLVPRGARVRRPNGLPLRVHYTDRWDAATMHAGRSLHRPAHAAALAAASFQSPRPACGVLAAVVQQRLVRPSDLVAVVRDATRIRHRAALLAAAYDIEQGAHALGEIDLGKLCRAAGLPAPVRQAVRAGADGRRRYVDAEWTRGDGRRIVVEVDGALHLVPKRWWDDQLRQNELVLKDDLVLRFPTVVLRHEKPIVVSQLSRALLLPADLPALPAA
jgi:hypothetical protein